mgnify:CR=1 FL=1
MSIWISGLAGLFAGLLGAMGLGGGSVLLLYLTLIAGTEQITAQGINLLFFIPCALVALLFHRKNKLIQWKTALWCAAGGLFGVLLGSFLAGLFSSSLLSKIFAVFLLLIGIREFLTAGKQREELIEEYTESKQSYDIGE